MKSNQRSLAGGNTGSVIEECDITATEDDEFDIVDIIKGTHYQLSRTDRSLYTRQDHTYWRGIAFMAVAHHSVRGIRDNIETLPDFIEWAGKRNDLKSILELVKERKTLDSENLMAIMKAKNATSAPLRSGTL